MLNIFKSKINNESKSLYNAQDIARFIINFSNNLNWDISNLRLQKLLYFIQVEFLMENETHTPCFYNEIKAWDYGPVIPEVYHEYKQYGRRSIPKVERYVVVDESNIWNSKTVNYNENTILEFDRKKISEIIDYYNQYKDYQLVDITHSQKPWLEAYKSTNKVISNKSIIDFFKSETTK